MQQPDDSRSKSCQRNMGSNVLEGSSGMKPNLRAKNVTTTNKGIDTLQQPNETTSSKVLTVPLQQAGLADKVAPGSILQQPNETSSKVLTFPLQQAGLADEVAPGSMQQPIQGDRIMLTLSDDNGMVRRIQETHDPDDRDFDCKTLLHLVEDILNRATLNPDNSVTTGTQAYIENLEEDKTKQAGLISLMDRFSNIIDFLFKIIWKSMLRTDENETTVGIFVFLPQFGWDAKLVLTLTAFAVNYGEFWLLNQICSTNQLAKAIAIVKQVPGIIPRTDLWKTWFDELNELIRAILEVTQCVVEFSELPSLSITQEVTALADIPTAVCWTIRSIVACTTRINGLTIGMGSNKERIERDILAQYLKSIRDHLKNLLEICHQYIDKKKDSEYFQMLLNLFEMPQIDNMKVLKALICRTDDLPPLVDGSTKRRVNIDVLRKKNVLLLISTLEISHNDLATLEYIYNESRLYATSPESQYEIVWIPIVDCSIQWTDLSQKEFESLQSNMPWYTVYHPSLIGKVVVKFIREVWHFRSKAILVVVDPEGRLVCPNAFHMMYIWGIMAFPFSGLREEALWREETWSLELLVGRIDETILNWIKEGKYIFLYGGDDADWIRKFTKSARSVAQAAGIPLEMVYMGKGSKTEQVRRIIATITTEKLSFCLQDPYIIWFFWTRLESMLLSQIQLGKTDEYDPMMQEIKKLLSYDKEGGWAILAKGSTVVVNGHGTTVLPTLLEYDKWKENVPLKGFDVAFKNHIEMIHHNSKPCFNIVFSNLARTIPENMKCPECRRIIEKYTAFLCCHDEAAPSICS